ncbi:DNA-3-methyladenine glycosylase 2 family protein [Ktedonobacter sp. SOSP1-85]|uniref:DNA-3-methyladenine glycosylase family protein n=1 Tax=Ktedonobacter sp. SOSP1-85 TaxID=2778367 RepID=UPI0019154FFE|nr:DNA-3-methyladenine glycosylase 2 family protein [Ktedonobacter sp. SOSP1-85]GHO80571.1 DNA-3-methyladenine glycosylase 2 family protein [Ktedonobacter sp. SOSP1-85]
MSSITTIEGTLTPRAPFSFSKTLQFVGDFTPTEGEQTVTTNSITKAITLHGRAVAFQVCDLGVEEPRLAYTLFTEQPLSDAEHEALRDRISFFLSLNDDLHAFYTIGRADPSFELLIDALYGLHQPKFLTPFEIACWSVLTQRNPIAMAHRTKRALAKRWGTSIMLPDSRTYHAFPEAGQLARMSIDELAAVVHNTRKAEYLYAVIQFFHEADEQYLRNGDYDEVATSIRSIRGIGEWSAYFILIRGLGRIERTTLSGKEILHAASKIYQREMMPAELQRIAETYGSYQGYWSFYMRAANVVAPMIMSR